jgi:MarR family transcriptional regulator for hemolysin
MDAGEEFALELGRVSRRWRSRLDERLRGAGLTQARWIVLLQLSQAGPMSQRELAERVGVEGPTLVRVLDKLERQGLVARRANDEDRRVRRIHLTEAVKPLLEDIQRIANALRGELLADVPADDLGRAVDVLKAIASGLEKA